LILLLAVIILGGASLPTQTVLFDFASLPENLLLLADEGVTGELTDSPAAVLKGEPPYRSAPLYGAVVLGTSNRFIFSLDGNTLYFDSDHDGDLRNNRPLTSQPAVKGLFRKTLLSFPPILTQLNYPDDVFQEWQEYRMPFTCRLENKTFSFLNLGYRFSRNALRQSDISAQWPLFNRWHAMARWNYSIQDRKTLESIAGLEYNQSCWTLRLVAQRFATATQQTSTSFFVQLELNDMVKMGSDPLSLLGQSVPGYTKTNDKPATKP